jgi:hypothetical protein
MMLKQLIKASNVPKKREESLHRCKNNMTRGEALQKQKNKNTHKNK